MFRIFLNTKLNCDFLLENSIKYVLIIDDTIELWENPKNNTKKNIKNNKTLSQL